MKWENFINRLRNWGGPPCRAPTLLELEKGIFEQAGTRANHQQGTIIAVDSEEVFLAAFAD
jgi:hypothetical protein